MQLSQSSILTTRYLNRVFDKTVATYKYYWYLGFLDLLWVILLKKLPTQHIMLIDYQYFMA